jgi:hypothetical protein
MFTHWNECCEMVILIYLCSRPRNGNTEFPSTLTPLIGAQKQLRAFMKNYQNICGYEKCSLETFR